LKVISRCASYLKQVTSALVDSGYSGQPFATAVSKKLGETVQIADRNELHTFKVKPKRWIVKRSCLAGKMPTLMGKLRTQAQHQSALHYIWLF
jgi:transposase